MWFRFATVKVGELDNKNDDIDAICKKDLRRRVLGEVHPVHGLV
jgi:hypothetical protein